MLKNSQQFSNARGVYDFFQTSRWDCIGRSYNNNNISALFFNKNKDVPKIMLIAGVHGNETEGVAFIYDFCKELLSAKNNFILRYQIYIIPILNPDGFFSHSRLNANKVDLNRNLPTKDWTASYELEKYYPGSLPCSEKENQVLVNSIEEFQPNFIISFHSWKPVINVNGCAMPHALQMRKSTQLKITEDIGYPTPGSLGTYAGLERGIPTITLEIERGLELSAVYPKMREGVLASFLEVKTS